MYSLGLLERVGIFARIDAGVAKSGTPN